MQHICSFSGLSSNTTLDPQTVGAVCDRPAVQSQRDVRNLINAQFPILIRGARMRPQPRIRIEDWELVRLPASNLFTPP